MVLPVLGHALCKFHHGLHLIVVQLLMQKLACNLSQPIRAYSLILLLAQPIRAYSLILLRETSLLSPCMPPYPHDQCD
jgi:hypothetical protein